ncbi:hypothetical protein Acr_00g0037820 [Actinidia rufa]|uniref:Uncharacterized protein n=1 Tax=Actinidia rufa TaxID=165716 RepID=A0A7J0DI77_9ERIC|nr:hypothetical protein Acr_00g0037820 [Actinidia rufa]
MKIISIRVLSLRFLYCRDRFEAVEDRPRHPQRRSNKASLAQRGCKLSRGQWGPNPSSYLADPSSRASIHHQPNVERGDGTLPPHLHVGLYQPRPNCDVTSRAPLQYCGHTSCVYRRTTEEGAGYTLLQGQVSRTVADLLAYESVYRHIIRHKADELGWIKLTSLRIKGWAPRCDNFSTDDFSVELKEDAPLTRVPTWEEGIISSSSSYNSSEFSGSEEEEGEKVIAHSFKEGSEFDTSLGEVNMALRLRTLGQKKSKPAANPLVASVAPVSQDPQPTPIPVLALAVQEDSHAAKGCSGSRTRGLGGNQGLICNAVGSRSLESYGHLGPYEATVIRVEELQEKGGQLGSQNEFTVVKAQRDKALQDLIELQVVAYGPVYERVFNKGISRARDNYDKQVSKLCPRIFMEGWLAYLTELRIPEDNPTWAKAAPEAEAF